MRERTQVAITGAVEGLVDEAILRRLVSEVGLGVDAVHGKRGKEYLRARIGGYNAAANRSPWLVIVDLNDECRCAPELCRNWLPSAAPHMCFRIAVRKVEAWLMADRERLAGFLGIPIAKVPVDPEGHRDPKRMLVDLARQSRRRQIRDDMVPRPEGGRAVGDNYSSRLIEFSNTLWRPDEAARTSDSLSRCLSRLRMLAASADVADSQRSRPRDGGL